MTANQLDIDETKLAENEAHSKEDKESGHPIVVDRTGVNNSGSELVTHPRSRRNRTRPSTRSKAPASGT